MDISRTPIALHPTADDAQTCADEIKLTAIKQRLFGEPASC
jgi:hypothetical protein